VDVLNAVTARQPNAGVKYPGKRKRWLLSKLFIRSQCDRVTIGAAASKLSASEDA